MSPRTKAPRRPGTAPRGGRASVSAETTGSDARLEDSTTATQLREARARAGLGRSALAARLAEAHPELDAEGWRVTIVRYETGARTPDATRLRMVLSALGESEEAMAAREIDRVVGPLLAEYAPSVLREALIAYAERIRRQIGRHSRVTSA